MAVRRRSPSSRPARGIRDVVDFDLCWAYDLVDPWGNQYELNCYEYERVRTDLIDADGITPARYWSRADYENYRTPPKPQAGNS